MKRISSSYSCVALCLEHRSDIVASAFGPSIWGAKGSAKATDLCFLVHCVFIALGLFACQGEKKTGGIEPQAMADALHAVMESDRIVYTKQVVNRLQNEEAVIKASEHWKDDKALPLPAQMFRMGAELVAEKKVGFNYALLSMWPVNKQNKPKTEVEKKGLEFVADKNNKGKNYYEEELLGDTKYFTAVYADTAVAPACVKCHNEHKDSPRKDFKLGEVMGGVVLRIPLSG